MPALTAANSKCQDGTRIVTALEDNSARVWHAASVATRSIGADCAKAFMRFYARACAVV